MQPRRCPRCQPLNFGDGIEPERACTCAPQSLQQRIEEARERYARQFDTGPTREYVRGAHEAGSQFVLDLLAKGGGEHPPRVWILRLKDSYQQGHYERTFDGPSTEGREIRVVEEKELQSARLELEAAKAEVEVKEGAIGNLVRENTAQMKQLAEGRQRAEESAKMLFKQAQTIEAFMARVAVLTEALDFYAKMSTNNYEAEGDGTVARTTLAASRAK